MGFTVGQQIGINAASSAIGGLIGLGTSAIQHKYNKELAEQQFAQNLTMWNKQNAYNTPTEQRKRLEDAGLNPALMYGGGQVSAGNASQMPQYQQMGVDIGQNMLSSMQMLQMAANIRNTEADTDKKNAEAGISEVELKYREQRLNAEIEGILVGNAKGRQEIKNMVQELENLRLVPAEVQARIDNYMQSIETNKALAGKYGAEKALTELRATIDSMLAPHQRDLLVSQKGAQDAKAVSDLALAENLDAKTIYQEWYNNFTRDNGYTPDANLQQLVIQLLGGVADHITGGEGGVQDAVNTLVDQFINKQRSWAERFRDKDASNPNSIYTKKFKKLGYVYNEKTHKWEPPTK